MGDRNSQDWANPRGRGQNPRSFAANDPRGPALQGIVDALGGPPRGPVIRTKDRSGDHRMTEGAPAGRGFGAFDLNDRNDLGHSFAGMGFPDAKPGGLGLGLGKGDAMLAAVNELADEWEMERFANLEEVSQEFLDKLEGMLF